MWNYTRSPIKFGLIFVAIGTEAGEAEEANAGRESIAAAVSGCTSQFRPKSGLTREMSNVSHDISNLLRCEGTP
jgi:hypothetical protein